MFTALSSRSCSPDPRVGLATSGWGGQGCWSHAKTRRRKGGAGFCWRGRCFWSHAKTRRRKEGRGEREGERAAPGCAGLRPACLLSWRLPGPLSSVRAWFCLSREGAPLRKEGRVQRVRGQCGFGRCCWSESRSRWLCRPCRVRRADAEPECSSGPARQSLPALRHRRPGTPLRR